MWKTIIVRAHMANSVFIRLLILIAAISIGGCATSAKPIPTEQAKRVPADRILDQKFMSPDAGMVSVVIKRDVGLVALCSVRFFVNGTAVADLMKGEKIELFLSPGDHMFAFNGNSVCEGTIVEGRVSVKENEPQTYRITQGPGGIYLTRTAF
jgi:hypothetical protein